MIAPAAHHWGRLPRDEASLPSKPLAAVAVAALAALAAVEVEVVQVEVLAMNSR